MCADHGESVRPRHRSTRRLRLGPRAGQCSIWAGSSSAWRRRSRSRPTGARADSAATALAEFVSGSDGALLHAWTACACLVHVSFALLLFVHFAARPRIVFSVSRL
eukprot:6213100-Pleurochrysis_carterae.AAC.3